VYLVEILRELVEDGDDVEAGRQRGEIAHEAAQLAAEKEVEGDGLQHERPLDLHEVQTVVGEKGSKR